MVHPAVVRSLPAYFNAYILILPVLKPNLFVCSCGGDDNWIYRAVWFEVWDQNNTETGRTDDHFPVVICEMLMANVNVGFLNREENSIVQSWMG